MQDSILVERAEIADSNRDENSGLNFTDGDSRVSLIESGESEQSEDDKGESGGANDGHAVEESC